APAAQWLDTGIRVGPNLGLKITAKGQVDLWPQQAGQYVVGPDGQGAGMAGGVARVNGRLMALGGGGGVGGELLGRIGEKGKQFVIGSRYTQTPKREGKLYLRIAPSPWGASAGEYQVTVATGPYGDDMDDDDD